MLGRGVDVELHQLVLLPVELKAGGGKAVFVADLPNESAIRQSGHVEDTELRVR